MTRRPVGAVPTSFPVWVLSPRQRVTTLAPSATWSSTVSWMSENALRFRSIVRFIPTKPSVALGS